MCVDLYTDTVHLQLKLFMRSFHRAVLRIGAVCPLLVCPSVQFGPVKSRTEAHRIFKFGGNILLPGALLNFRIDAHCFTSWYTRRSQAQCAVASRAANSTAQLCTALLIPVMFVCFVRFKAAGCTKHIDRIIRCRRQFSCKCFARDCLHPEPKQN